MAELQAIVVIVWLVICAASDLKSRIVPNLLTLIPLTAALVLTAVRGNWPVVVFLVFLVAISDLPRHIAQPISVIALIAVGVIATKIGMLPEMILVSIILFIVYQLWLYGLTGGADAKILMTLALVYGSPAFLAATLAGGVFGVVALVLKKRTLPYVLPILAGMVAYFVLLYVVRVI